MSSLLVTLSYIYHHIFPSDFKYLWSKPYTIQVTYGFCGQNGISVFKKYILFIFREGEGREKERERNIDVQETYQSVASCMPPSGDLACNPGTCPDWESKQQPFSLQASAQSTEPHQPQLISLSLDISLNDSLSNELPKFQNNTGLLFYQIKNVVRVFYLKGISSLSWEFTEQPL